MVRVCGVGSLVGAPGSAPTNTRGIRTDSGACVGRCMLLEDAGELRRPEPKSRTEEIARRVNEHPTISALGNTIRVAMVMILLNAIWRFKISPET